MDAIKVIISEIEKLKEKRDYPKAIETVQNALANYQDDYRLYEELADIYLFNGKLEKATKAIDFALNINPESATGNYLKGFIILSEGKNKEAISYLEKSNKLMPNNPEVLRNLGWAYNMTDKNSQGVILLKRALNISPNDELITEDLAMALIGTGNISEGNALLKKIGKETKQISC